LSLAKFPSVTASNWPVPSTFNQPHILGWGVRIDAAGQKTGRR
jgi:hypothetical protein